jgi:hypothetical protein
MELVKFLVVFIHLVLPVIFLIGLYRSKPSSQFARVSYYGLVVLFLVVFWFGGSAWSWFGHIWADLFCLMLVPVLMVNARRTAGLKVWPSKKLKLWTIPIVNSLLILFFSVELISIAKSYRFDELPVHLKFPLGTGNYHVMHGGNSVSLNYHNPIPAQKFALDVVKVNSLGTRASGLMPKKPEDYRIYKEKLYSPCVGEVLATENEIADATPMELSEDKPLGNFVSIFCRGNTVVIAHMLKGSVTVSKGDIVQTGTYLGEIGNSGRTTEPHLHIHAVQGRVEEIPELLWDGSGTPILFDEKFLVRNDIYKVK